MFHRFGRTPQKLLLWFALCKYDSCQGFLFVYVYSFYLFCFSIYKGLLFFFYTNRFNPTKDQVENISWVLYWTEALINTWPCIKSRSAARVKIFNERKLLQEKKKKKAKKWTICWWLHTLHWRDIFILPSCRVL